MVARALQPVVTIPPATTVGVLIPQGWLPRATSNELTRHQLNHLENHEGFKHLHHSSSRFLWPGLED